MSRNLLIPKDWQGEGRGVLDSKLDLPMTPNQAETEISGNLKLENSKPFLETGNLKVCV